MVPNQPRAVVDAMSLLLRPLPEVKKYAFDVTSSSEAGSFSSGVQNKAFVMT